MDYVSFEALLKAAGLSKKEFAGIVEMNYHSVTNWKKSGKVPHWVETWLKLYIENKDCRDLKRIIREAVCKDEVGEEA